MSNPEPKRAEGLRPISHSFGGVFAKAAKAAQKRASRKTGNG